MATDKKKDEKQKKRGKLSFGVSKWGLWGAFLAGFLIGLIPVIGWGAGYILRGEVTKYGGPEWPWHEEFPDPLIGMLVVGLWAGTTLSLPTTLYGAFRIFF